MKRILLAVVCMGFVITLIGCETLRGVAKDIENTGKNVGDFLKGEKK